MNAEPRTPVWSLIALALVSVAITIGGLDAMLRFASVVAPRRGEMEPVPAPHTLSGWVQVFPPGYVGTLRGPDFRVKIQSNALGLRERELDVAALAPTRPIVFLGDSYFFGWGVEQPERFTEVLAGRLAAEGHDVPVVNVSFPGWSTFHYAEIWKSVVAPLRPRLVVISTFIGNDFTDDIKQAGTRQNPGSQDSDGSAAPIVAPGLAVRAQLAGRELLATSPVVSLLNRALWSSPRFRRAFGFLEVRNDRIALYESSPSDLQAQLYGATRKGMAALGSLSREDGIPVLDVIIPDQLQVLMPDLFDGFTLDEPQRRLGRMLDDEGMRHLDLLPTFESLAAPDDLFFREDKHWNARGHARIAGVVHEALQPYLTPVADRREAAGTGQRPTASR